jgi:hypothetical protein
MTNPVDCKKTEKVVFPLVVCLITHFGFSSGSGSPLPRPTGFLSASSFDNKCISASTFPVNSISSLSFLMKKGHHPFTLFCLKIFTTGTEPSVFNMSNVHSLEDFAPRGKRFKSRVIAPEIYFFQFLTGF